jgi:phenylacetate-CoA ligase
MNSSEFPKYYNEEIETMPQDQLRKEVQEPRFLKQLEYVLNNSRFYQKKFENAGLQLEDIRGLQDLGKIPFTEKDEIRLSQEQTPPLGSHVACSKDKVLRIYSSSGTSGRPTYIGLTRHDLDEVWLNIIPRTYYCTGMRPNDVLVFTVQVGPFVAGATLQGYERIGVTTIPLGPGQTERLISAYKNIGANILMATPSYAEYLIDWCNQRGIDIPELGVEKVVVAGEPGGSIPAVREKIETAYNATCVEGMGIADISPSIWGECPDAKHGMHFCAQEFVFVELIDPESGELIEWADGAKGELVYTALDRECVPLIRFRSRDHVEVWASKCVCGRTSCRVRVLGRTDDMLIVRGVNVFPSAIKAVVSEFQPRTTGYIEIHLSEPGPKIKPPLSVKVEYGSEAKDLDTLKADLETTLREKLVFRSAVELVPEGTLPRSEYKARLIRKLYEEK